MHLKLAQYFRSTALPIVKKKKRERESVHRAGLDPGSFHESVGVTASPFSAWCLKDQAVGRTKLYPVGKLLQAFEEA